METPAILQVCTTPKCKCIRFIKIAQDAHYDTSSRIISLRFISNKFPRLLAEREIIANAFSSPDFSPNRLQRYKIILKAQKNNRFIFALNTEVSAVVILPVPSVCQQGCIGHFVAADRSLD